MPDAGNDNLATHRFGANRRRAVSIRRSIATLCIWELNRGATACSSRRSDYGRLGQCRVERIAPRRTDLGRVSAANYGGIVRNQHRGSPATSGFDLVELIDAVEANDIDKTAILFSFDSTETDPWIKSLDGSSTPISLAHVANAQQSLYLAGERHLTFWHPAAGQRIPIPGVQWHFGKLSETLAAGSSATVEVWQVNATSGDHEDSTFSVTAYDWLLSTGDTLASGTAVMIVQHLQSKRWYVFAANCGS